jgi:pSer/pThr/pTyr-binding forkhead associated (FHA) protein
MFELRVSWPDGTTTTHAFQRAQCKVGRAVGNDVRLDETAISAMHCAFEVSPAGCLVVDRGSTNGTWIDGRRVEGSASVREGARVWVGPFLLELRRATPSAPSPPVTPILRTLSDRSWRDDHGRLARHADEWDRHERPSRLVLRGRELVRARAWLLRAKGERAGEVTRLQRELVAASEREASMRSLRRALVWVAGVASLGAVVTAVAMHEPALEESPLEEPVVDSTVIVEDESSEGGFEPLTEIEVDDEVGDVDEPIEHVVIPFETLGDIAMRYGVAIDEIAASNYLDPDDPDLTPGRTLAIEEPSRRPLAQTKIAYEIEAGEASWTTLADRFGVPATRLQAYNAGVDLAPGSTIAVWIDPKPYAPRDPDAKIPDYAYGEDARSIGKTTGGRLVGGLQLPASPLYTRRAPSIMYGSAFTIEHVTEAVAAFRRDVAYDGELILADISRPGGGHFEPHKSHQSGRDIDIWLPTLKGVYKRKYLAGGRERERRPMLGEIDWYALWGLVRALIKTGAVQDIFLDWSRQEYVYRAAVNMGATPEELDEWIQWPRPRTHGKGIFRHSEAHLSHIHVRFKCAKWEKDCDGKRAKVVED